MTSVTLREVEKVTLCSQTISFYDNGLLMKVELFFLLRMIHKAPYYSLIFTDNLFCLNRDSDTGVMREEKEFSGLAFV
jgi:hypothetical protein